LAVSAWLLFQWTSLTVFARDPSASNYKSNSCHLCSYLQSYLKLKLELGARADQLLANGKKMNDKFAKNGGRPSGRSQVNYLNIIGIIYLSRGVNTINSERLFSFWKKILRNWRNVTIVELVLVFFKWFGIMSN
jgi:hypothetical protein